MRTFIIEGKPLEEVTIKVEGQSLTLTAGVEVTVIVVVASQQSVHRTGLHDPVHEHNFENSLYCSVCCESQF